MDKTEFIFTSAIVVLFALGLVFYVRARSPVYIVDRVVCLNGVEYYQSGNRLAPKFNTDSTVGLCE